MRETQDLALSLPCHTFFRVPDRHSSLLSNSAFVQISGCQADKITLDREYYIGVHSARYLIVYRLFPSPP